MSLGFVLMISAEFINNVLLFFKKPSNCLKAIVLVCIFSYYLVSRTYHIDTRFGFDHDQEKAAESAWALLRDHKISLIGIETSRGGVFAGPMLNWTHAIFLQIWNFDPIALAYQAILINVLLILFIFTFVRKISNSNQALIAIILYTLSPRMISYDISGSPISYMNVHTMLVIYIYYKIVYEKKKNLLNLLGLVIGLGYHIHVFLLFSIVPTVFLLWKHKVFGNKQNFAQLLIFFSVPLLSAFVFDIKHHFLMTKNILFLIRDDSQSELLKIIQIPKTLLSLLSDTIIQTTWTKPSMVIPIAILSKYMFLNKSNTIYKDYIIFIIAPCLLLLFYGGPISEYYLIAAVVPFVIFSSSAFLSILKFNKYIFLIIFALITVVNTNTTIVKSKNPHSLRAKKEVLEDIIKTSNSQQVNIMYNLPQEYNYGFTYLVKWYKIKENKEASNKFLVEHATEQELYSKSQNLNEKFGYFKLSSIK